MNDSDPSCQGSALPTASFRVSPEDFLVEEIPAYPTSGEGDHLHVTFRKTGHNTPYAVRCIAEALGVDGRQAGTAGMKDRHAVTTQRASFPFPTDRDPAEALALELDGIEILEAARHGNKLKTGHLAGNRFVIVLRDLAPEAFETGDEALRGIVDRGVPNRFGRQRFGRTGDNAERALAFVTGQDKPPRDKKKRRFLFSALQSKLFNLVVDRREADGTLATVLPGDLAKKHDSGGLFTVPAEGRELDDAVERAAAGLLSATGPMFGAKMRWPEGVPEAIERQVLAEHLGDESLLLPFKSLGQGTRRPLRLWVEGLAWEPNRAAGYLTVSFVLPQGGYATTVLGQAFELVERRQDSAGANVHSP